MFIVAMALQFTGGRGISASSGSDRTSLWGQGLGLLRSHPLFGVGFDQMASFTDAHLTAHNSVVVCAAELGLFGLFFWSLFLLPTATDAFRIASPAKVIDGRPIVPEDGLYQRMTKRTKPLDKTEVNRLGMSVVLSLTGFLSAGLFLSRAYVLTLFLLGGMAEIVYEMALARGMVAPRPQLGRILWYASGLMIALILGMYVVLRILNLMH